MTKFLDERLGGIFKTPEQREYNAFDNAKLPPKKMHPLGCINKNFWACLLVFKFTKIFKIIF